MKNLQKKAYHSNRFYAHPQTLKQEVDERFQAILAKINPKIIHSAEFRAYIELGNLVLYVPKDDILDTLSSLKNASFDMLSEMSAIHLEDKRFEVFYQLLSMELHLRIRVKAIIQESVDSVCGTYRNALWCEREAYDMFGIKFLNHPNLKRLIMPDDWSGHPLRKDYPLQGDEDAQWYEIDKIFGEEYREIVGAEQRDSSFINPKDTFNFSHMGYEVPKGVSPSTQERETSYQEKSGVFVVTKFDKPKQLKERR